MLLTIDPASAGRNGLALWWKGTKELFRAWSCKPSFVVAEASYALLNYSIGEVVIEDQFITKGSKVPPGDILKLAKHAHYLAGFLVGMEVPVMFISPKAWKGATRKPKTGVEYVIRRRCQKVLTPHEISRVETDDHDTWDAVGMGLVVLGRAGVGVVTR